MDRCGYCGSVFGDRRCYFCETACCTGCMTDDRTRCKRCYVKKARLGWRQVVRKNKAVLAFAAGLWLYAVFPGPLMPGLDPTFYAVTVVAAVLILLPVGLALFFWSLNPPSSDLRGWG